MDFEIPASLDGLDAAALDALRQAAVAAFDELKADESLDADGLAKLKALACCVKDIDVASGELAAQAQARQDEIDALNEQVHGAADEGAEGEGEGGGSGPDASAEAGDGSDDGAGDEGGSGAGDTGAPADAPKAPAMASVAKAAARQRKPVPKTPGAHSRAAKVLAAANVADKPHNSPYRDAGDLADAFARAFSSFPNGGGSPATVATRLSANVARIELPYDEKFVLSGGSRDVEVIDAACDQKRLPGGNLTAAGTWCAPNEQIWELCPGLETAEGIWDAPGFTLRRPGVQYPSGLDFRDLYEGKSPAGAPVATGDLHFTWNETSTPPKPCWTMPCPTWPEWRMEVDGMCVKADIIMAQMWPEWVRHVIGRVPVAHQHRINARLLKQVFTDVTAAPKTGYLPFTLAMGDSDLNGDTTFTGVMGAIGLAATHIRYSYRTRDDFVVEGIAPMWLRDWIRADIARRNAMALWEISDQQIDNWLLRRKVRLQWVYDTQDAFNADGTLTSGKFGARVAPQAWPDEVQIVLYPAGTFSIGTRPIIDLSAVYDSTNLARNEYIALFSEQAMLLVKRCYASWGLTIKLCPTGAGPTAADLSCTAPAAAAGEVTDLGGAAEDAAALQQALDAEAAGDADGGANGAAEGGGDQGDAEAQAPARRSRGR